MGELTWGLPPSGVSIAKSGNWRFERADVVRVIDGDSLILKPVIGATVDAGFGDEYTWSFARPRTFRLLGINAIELANPGGKEARDNLRSLLPVGTQLRLESVKNDKYARYDAWLWLDPANICVNVKLVDEQWAVFWDGTGKAPVPPWPRTIAGTGNPE